MNNPTYTIATQGGQSQHIALHEQDVYNRMSDPLAAVERLGEIIASSGMFGCTKVEQGQVLALQCISEKKPPLELAKTYHMIEGKLSMRADAMLAKFQLSGGTVKWTRRDDKVVEATFTLRGNSLPFSARLEDFVTNGVAVSRDGKMKDNWRKFPRQMLTARVISEAVRLLAPEVVFGVYTPEEIQDNNNSAPAQDPIKVEPIVESYADQLTAILIDHEQSVNAYLIAKKQISEGQTFRDVAPDFAKKILSNSKMFLEAVNSQSK
jgi:hypothetical protein